MYQIPKDNTNLRRVKYRQPLGTRWAMFLRLFGIKSYTEFKNGFFYTIVDTVPHRGKIGTSQCTMKVHTGLNGGESIITDSYVLEPFSRIAMIGATDGLIILVPNNVEYFTFTDKTPAVSDPKIVTSHHANSLFHFISLSELSNHIPSVRELLNEKADMSTIDMLEKALTDVEAWGRKNGLTFKQLITIPVYGILFINNSTLYTQER